MIIMSKLGMVSIEQTTIHSIGHMIMMKNIVLFGFIDAATLTYITLLHIGFVEIVRKTL